MKIKLTILDSDSNYLNRLVSAFKARYSEILEIFSYTTLDAAMADLEKNKSDVFVADAYFKVDAQKIPSSCGFAYLTSSQNEKVDGEVRKIFKFQRADRILDEITDIHKITVALERERLERMEKEKLEKERLEKERLEQERRKNANKIVVFLPTSGGVGVSTLAAACAIHFAKLGRKTLYLSTEFFGSTDAFFKGEGGRSLIDVVNALKDSDIASKIDGYAVKDASGVYFYTQPDNPIDMLAVTSQDIFKLIESLKNSYIYDCIVLDCGPVFDKGFIDIYTQSQGLVFVGNGTEISNMKAAAAVNVMEKIGTEAQLKDKTAIVYNRFNQSSGEKTELIKCVGTLQELETNTARQTAEQLSDLDIFDSLLK